MAAWGGMFSACISTTASRSAFNGSGLGLLARNSSSTASARPRCLSVDSAIRCAHARSAGESRLRVSSASDNIRPSDRTERRSRKTSFRAATPRAALSGCRSEEECGELPIRKESLIADAAKAYNRRRQQRQRRTGFPIRLRTLRRAAAPACFVCRRVSVTQPSGSACPSTSRRERLRPVGCPCAAISGACRWPAGTQLCRIGGRAVVEP